PEGRFADAGAFGRALEEPTARAKPSRRALLAVGLGAGSLGLVVGFALGGVRARALGVAAVASGTRFDPRVASAFERASACLGQNEHDGAIAAYTRVIELDPEIAPAWHGRALARSGKRDFAGA